MIECPYCLTPQSFSRGEQCENEACGKNVSRLYIESARLREPIFIVTFGVTQHGKSTLLGSMSFLVERIGVIAQGAFHNYLDTHTMQRLAEIQRGQQTGNPGLGATPLTDNPEPLLLMLKNFPTQSETQTLVIFDLAGEVVDRITERIADRSAPPPLYARAIAKARTIWFIVSLYDLQREMVETGRSINALFMAYQQVMMHFNAALRDRNVLTIFTKADLLRENTNDDALVIPQSVSDYLADDRYYDLGNRGASRPPVLDYDRYASDLYRVSDELQSFTEMEVTGGSAFVAMVEDSGAKLHFNIGSAQGSGSTGMEIKRYRALDPLIWSILLSQGPGHQSGTTLILATQDANGLYQAGLHTVLLDRLRARNRYPQSYFTGEMRPAFAEGNLPPDPALPIGRMGLIGPILDRQPSGGIAVVLVGDQLPADIDDFAYTSWDDRLVVIGTSQQVLNARVRWKYRAETPSEVEQALRDFFQYYDNRG